MGTDGYGYVLSLPLLLPLPNLPAKPRPLSRIPPNVEHPLLFSAGVLLACPEATNPTQLPLHRLFPHLRQHLKSNHHLLYRHQRNLLCPHWKLPSTCHIRHSLTAFIITVESSRRVAADLSSSSSSPQTDLSPPPLSSHPDQVSPRTRTKQSSTSTSSTQRLDPDRLHPISAIAQQQHLQQHLPRQYDYSHRAHQRLQESRARA